ncbi:MAG: long-chain acyl-CoA synthetase, partial [Actinomycetota bacterium]|nr:long-chain acyl-CoA synthetase [Actinomycetota bacterium]
MNLATILDGHPDEAPALISRGQVTSYGDLRAQVGELRGGLTGLGVVAGDRVAIACANNWFFAVSYFAVLGIGAVAVPLNPASPTAELETELKAIGARTLIAGPAARDAVNGIDRSAVGLDLVISPDGSGVDDATAVESLLGGASFPLVDRQADDLAVLVFTSGTAGSPKAAMLTHGNLLSNIDQGQRLPARRIEASDVSFGVLPL